MKKKIRAALLLLAVPALGLVAYESWRVAVARARTPALITAALKDADTQVLRLPPSRIAMLLAVEDPSFWVNDGTDFAASGADVPTLTQSLGKQIYFPNGFTPGFRKLELVLDAKYALTKLATKEDILHAFLVRAWMGRDDKGPIYGFAEAARRFYGEELVQLTDDEYLSLVALLYAPAEMNPLRHPRANADRVARIKKLLANRCTPAGFSDVALAGCAG